MLSASSAAPGERRGRPVLCPVSSFINHLVTVTCQQSALTGAVGSLPAALSPDDEHAPETVAIVSPARQPHSPLTRSAARDTARGAKTHRSLNRAAQLKGLASNPGSVPKQFQRFFITRSYPFRLAISPPFSKWFVYSGEVLGRGQLAQGAHRHAASSGPRRGVQHLSAVWW